MKRLMALSILIVLTGCASQIKPKVEVQLTRQDVKDVVADVVKQSSQNGLFNLQLDEAAAGWGLLIVFGGGLAASFTRKGVTYGVGSLRRKRKLDQWDTTPNK